jgi:hypothetical protein
MTLPNPSPPHLPQVRQQAQDYRAQGRAYLDQLPRYSGIAGIDRAGLSVEQCAAFVARFAAIERQCVFIAAARMPDVREYELKTALARWMWEDATHCQSLENRVAELRSNKAAVRKVLDYQLGDFLCEILHSPGSLELCVGLFEVLSPAYCAAIRDYLSQTQPLADFPTVRLLKGILSEEEERLRLGNAFLASLKQQKGGEAIARDWRGHLEQFLAAAQGVLGCEPLPDGRTKPAPRAAAAFRPTHEFARDERFTAVVPKIVPGQVKDDPLRTMMWVRREELCVAETVAVILYDWGDDLPTEAIVDLARQCWDEARHSLFGQAALEGAGFPLQALESWVGFGMHALAESPQKAFAHLSLAIEAGAMASPGGKRGEWEYCRDVARHPLMTTFQDFDWADEIAHVNYGRKWIIEHHFKGNREAARNMADESISDRVRFYEQYGFRDWMSERPSKARPKPGATPGY